MKKGIRDSEFCINSLNNEFQGVMLGWDYTSQHEHGIATIQNEFGMKSMDEGFIGLESRILNKIPEGLKYIENKYKGSCYSHIIFDNYNIKTSDLPPVAYLSGVEDFSTAWDANSFGISVKGSKNIKRNLLKKLYMSMLNKDVALLFVSKNSKNPFSRNSPFLGIISKMEKEFIKSIYDFDLSIKQLKDASQDTGIHDFFKDKGIGFYKLEPAWANTIAETMDNRKLNTKYKVIYYLNPIDTNLNNSGWFTVEDLKLWTHGVGPIPKMRENNSLDYILREE